MDGKGKGIEGATLNGVESDKRSISSLEPSPPTPPMNVITASTTEIGLPPNSAELKASEDRTVLASKRLCERWLDNLFMVLYEVPTPFSDAKLTFFCRIYECIPFGGQNGNISRSSSYNSVNRIVNGSYSANSPCDYTTRYSKGGVSGG